MTTLQSGRSLSSKWRYPSTVWDGNPVLGFMAESDFTDAQGKSLQEVSFADFNPM